MSVRTESRTIHTCDRCKRSGEQYARGPFHSAGAQLSVAAWGMAPNGDTGGGTYKIDLCQDCLSAFEAWLRDLGVADEEG